MDMMERGLRKLTTLERRARHDLKKARKRSNLLLSRGVMMLEDEKPIVAGVLVRAASLGALVETCVLSFDMNGKLLDGSQFPAVLLLMHQWFATSVVLAGEFHKLYSEALKHASCEPACLHKDSDPQCGRQQFKMKLCHAVRYWIRRYPHHFDLDRRLAEVVNNLRKQIESEQNTELLQLLDLSTVPSFDWMRNMSVRHNMRNHPRKVSLVFNHLDAAELADHLSYLEYKAIRRISFSDYQDYAVQGTIRNNPRLERSIALFNSLSQWLQCMILSRTNPEQRAQVMVKFINVAKRLRQLQNFNTLMAVVGGLSHSALARLTRTHACVPMEAKKLLVDYTELLSSASNFSNYRRALSESKGFKIPILGVHLKDLISLHTALPDRIEGALINFRKITQMYGIFSELMQLQDQQQFPVATNIDLINTLRLSLDLHYTEDEIYELSLAREPKTSVSSPCQPLRPPVFSDWAAGVVTQPDAATINKHVNAMVDAVFKHYDHDRDGFISQTEFDQIASNFPFIDSFCVLDADQDGMISKAEMKKYFIRANCHVALRSGFKHEFHETTYFKPTYCVHCTGLLWGLIKQGYKCRECGASAHKHCKDSLVMECRRQLNSSPGLSHRSSSFSSADLSVAAKRQMNRRQKRRNASTISQRGTQTDKEKGPAIAAPCNCGSQSVPTERRVRFRSKSECGPDEDDNSDSDSDKELQARLLVKREGTATSNDSLCSQEGVCSELQEDQYTEEGGQCSRSRDSRVNESSSSSTETLKEGLKVGEDNVFCDTQQRGTPAYEQHSENHKDGDVCRPSSDHESALCYGDDSHDALLQRLAEVEEHRAKLCGENSTLRAQLSAANEEVHSLREHIGTIREHTVTFILNQMDIFHMQKDTQV
ncbi:PREDICTED: ras guanyl-releasing protein 3-like [Priapulus caudatus]|uniref:Ras guanyl-releasing protein 3-like n=1 Tax=Priapulus caudatus TaxID=37621 RepID=A0ABM1EQN7_PRICU|nr:PREDICTED: ras guanyl-releasing protein 3-like [Priapulus caudatus]